MIDVNVQWEAQKRSQRAGADAAVERNRQAIADYDSGLTQQKLDEKLAADVASGKIKMVGPDKYQFAADGAMGWDAYETFSVQRARRPNELPQVILDTGLEEVNGKASLFTARPAWHDLGFDNGGVGTTDIDLAIERGGLDFGISQRPVLFYDDHGNLHEMPGKYVNARDDTWAGLGVVGDIYKSVQPRESFGWMQDLTGGGQMIIESAGVLRGGAKTFITVSLPETCSIDPGGVNIEFKPYLALLDDHAGERKLWACLTPWIVLCGNTHNFAFRDAASRWGIRHSTNIHSKLEVARETLGLTVKGYEAFTAEEETLLHTGMTTNEFDAFLATLYERTGEDATKNARTREAKRDDALHEVWALETGRLGTNRFAAEMALTGYWDNQVRKVTDGKSAVARATALLEGEDKRKNAVHRQLLTVDR